MGQWRTLCAAAWFSPAYHTKYRSLGLSENHHFATKLDLALQIVDHVQANKIPFVAVDCNLLYGYKGWRCDQFAQRKLEYYADVPETTRVYWEKPWSFFPTTKCGQQAKRPQVLSVSSLVKELVNHCKTELHTIVLRPGEHDMLCAAVAQHRV